jgi:hypothetical protein
MEKRQIVMVDYDPRWPEKFQKHAALLSQAETLSKSIIDPVRDLELDLFLDLGGHVVTRLKAPSDSIILIYSACREQTPDRRTVWATEVNCHHGLE